MRINGKQVISNTLVITPGDKAEIETPVGFLPVEFKTDNSPGRIEFEGGTLVIYNMDNSLGAAATPTINAQGIPPIPLRLALYTIGDAASRVRVLHYTVG